MSLSLTSRTGNVVSDGGEHVAEVAFDTFLAESQGLAPNPSLKSQDGQNPWHSAFVCGPSWPPEISCQLADLLWTETYSTCTVKI